MCKFHVIGISDQSAPVFSEEVKQLIGNSLCFSGGARHYELVKSQLPPQHQWIDVEVPLQATFDQYRQVDQSIVVFASGDPLFFGIGNTLKREFPDAEMQVYPTFNSLQMLAHACHLPYGTMVISTLTGRPWINLDQQLIKGTELIGVLTDKKKTPAAIAQRMNAVGLTNYHVYLGERMGGSQQCVRKMSIDELCQVEALAPNCLILHKTAGFTRTFGISECDFHYLDGRPKMITKRSIRLMSLSLLKLDAAKVMWDIGFCTGSVSIEAKQMAPHVEVFAIEKREESRELMCKNQQRFKVPGIESVIGDFYQTDLSHWPAPDRIFIGGHGGRLTDMITQLNEHLKPGGILVFNAVSKETEAAFKDACKALSLDITDTMILKQDDHNEIVLLQATKHNTTTQNPNS